MLNRAESEDGVEFAGLKPEESLPVSLQRICKDFSSAYGAIIEIYTWAHLLLPERVSSHSDSSKHLPVPVEFFRICSPLINERASKNVERNMRLYNRFKNLLHKIKKKFAPDHCPRVKCRVLAPIEEAIEKRTDEHLFASRLAVMAHAVELSAQSDGEGGVTVQGPTFR